MSDVFCRNCRYYGGGISITCRHPAAGRDVVTGEDKRLFAHVMRRNYGPCGPEGRLFEPVKVKGTDLRLPRTLWERLRSPFTRKDNP